MCGCNKSRTITSIMERGRPAVSKTEAAGTRPAAVNGAATHTRLAARRDAPLPVVVDIPDRLKQYNGGREDITISKRVTIVKRPIAAFLRESTAYFL